MLYFDPTVLSGAMQVLTESRSGCVELSSPVFRNREPAAHFSTLFRILTDSRGGHSEIEQEETLLIYWQAYSQARVLRKKAYQNQLSWQRSVLMMTPHYRYHSMSFQLWEA